MQLLRDWPSYKLALKLDPCSYCSQAKNLDQSTIDHIKPRFNGGGRAKKGSKPRSSNSWQNLTGACYECNQLKSTDSLLWFMLGRFKRHLKREQAKKRKWIYYDPSKAIKKPEPLQEAPQKPLQSMGSLAELARYAN